MVNIFSLSVSGATLPKPTLVIQVIVKYKAVTYIVLLDGPFVSSVVVPLFIQEYEYGICVKFANFHSHEYWIAFSASERPTNDIITSPSTETLHLKKIQQRLNLLTDHIKNTRQPMGH